MVKDVWGLIKESKMGMPYMNSDEQFGNLVNILSSLDVETINKLYEEWNQKTSVLIKNKEFEKLHVEGGGFVSSGDDGFYMDFANWVTAQGKPLYNRFIKYGHQTIVNFIEKHQIDEDDYMYECMIYVFQEVLKPKGEFKI